MGFLYPDKKTDEMSDLEILEDFLFTQNKIEADLRAILAHLDDEEYGKKAKDGDKTLKYYTSELRGGVLTQAFIKACHKHTTACYLPKPLNCIEDYMNEAWVKYEHILWSPYSDMATNPDKKLTKGASLRLREKYDSYNRFVMPFYEFFKKPNEEKAKILFGNLRKKLAPRKPLYDKEYSELRLNDIVAFTFASYGAMGEPGVMNIITKYMDVFGVGIDKYIEMGNKFGLAHMFGANDIPSMQLMRQGECPIVRGWYAFYTGFGNSLYVRDEYCEKAKEFIVNTLGEKWSVVDLYGKRFDVVEYAINNTTPEDIKKFKEQNYGEVEIDTETINSFDYDDIIAIKFTPENPQSNRFNFIVITNDLKKYHVNATVYFDDKYGNVAIDNDDSYISLKKLTHKLTFLKKLEPGFHGYIGTNLIKEKGWNNIPIATVDVRQLLFVKESIADKFRKIESKHEGVNRGYWISRNWFNVLRSCTGQKLEYDYKPAHRNEVYYWLLHFCDKDGKRPYEKAKVNQMSEDDNKIIYSIQNEPLEFVGYVVFDKKEDTLILVKDFKKLEKYL